MPERAHALLRLRPLLAGSWLGLLLCVALITAPAAFATLPAPDAGRVMGRVFLPEAYASLLLGVLLALLERLRARYAAGRQFSFGLTLALGALFCTVAGYFALQPLMDAARAGEGGWSFGQLHAVSLSFFALKSLLVLVLAWRTTSA